MAADVGGYVFEALALAAGAVVLVEPILSTALLLSLFLGAVLNKRRVGRSSWLAAAALAAGVALFLNQVSPTGGRATAPLRLWLLTGVPLLAVLAVCIGAARLTSGSTRAALLGAGAGVAFGASAVLTKGFVHFLGDGVFAWVGHWEPYALAVCSIGGLVLSQSAFQTGSLGAALGGEQVMQPLTGVALGVGLLNEEVGTAGLLQPLAIAVSMVALVWGVVTLAQVEHQGMAAKAVPAPEP
jgi:drug/metabolite transporter (DMT)-like permease